MKKIMVVAPHPDDETLGCGGTLLRHQAEGDELHWLIITSITLKAGYTQERTEQREQEIQEVRQYYPFKTVTNLYYPPARLDTLSVSEMTGQVGQVFQQVKPEIIYIPFQGDVHTDHQIASRVASSCTKWFRYPFIKRVLAYETLSETDFGIAPENHGFHPNIFVNITNYLQKKLEIMQIFKSEVEPFPFPRSLKALEALAQVRGAASGYAAAEAFVLLRERY